MLKMATKLIVFSCLLLLLSGCAPSGGINFNKMLQSFRFESEAKQIDSIRLRADRLLDDGKAIPTLSILRTEISRGIPIAKLSDQYARAINLAIDQADQHFARQQHLEAGTLAHAALIFYPESKDLQKKIKVNREDISEKMNICADQLLENGLLAYRSGQLEEAIDVWSQIRQFHPSYKASQLAIQTTRTQLRNLELLNNKQPENGT